MNLSHIWKAWEISLNSRIREMGVARWKEFPEIQYAILVSPKDVLVDQDHYRYYAKLCDDILWPNEHPSTIMDFGAGYGAMASFWPADAAIINVDIDPMREIQKHYLESLKPHRNNIVLLSPDDLGAVDWSQVYFFSAFAFTETTLGMWKDYIANVFPQCRGAFITGDRRNRDDEQQWPWEELEDCFDTVVVNKEVNIFNGPRMEFCGKNT